MSLASFLFPQVSRQHSVGLFLLGGTAFHAASLLSSSFVEEEHQTWYFLTVTACVLIGLEHCRRSAPNDNDVDIVDYSSVVKHAQKELGDDSYKQIDTRYRGTTEEKILCVDERRNTGTDFVTGKSVVTCVSSLVAVLVCCRVSRMWNQTGDKWSHLPDVGDWLVR